MQKITYFTWIFLLSAASHSALSTPYDQAKALFQSGQPAVLSQLLLQNETVDRSGRCVSITSKQTPESRAYVSLHSAGEFGKDLFISFEYFKPDDSDESIIQYSNATHKLWSVLFESRTRLLQTPIRGLYSDHFIEYRHATSRSGVPYLIRKYYTTSGAWHGRLHIGAFDGIEYCWVEV